MPILESCNQNTGKTFAFVADTILTNDEIQHDLIFVHTSNIPLKATYLKNANSPLDALSILNHLTTEEFEYASKQKEYDLKLAATQFRTLKCSIDNRFAYVQNGLNMSRIIQSIGNHNIIIFVQCGDCAIPRDLLATPTIKYKIISVITPKPASQVADYLENLSDKLYHEAWVNEYIYV